jgi:hypothetical protein
MTNERKITIDGLLQCDPPRGRLPLLTAVEQRHFCDALFGRAPRRWFDPRRITDGMRRPATPVTGGAVVYGAALAAGEAIDRMGAVPVDVAALAGCDPPSPP